METTGIIGNENTHRHQFFGKCYYYCYEILGTQSHTESESEVQSVSRQVKGE